jgi:Flp pilus assembly pilin Flp
MPLMPRLPGTKPDHLCQRATPVESLLAFLRGQSGVTSTEYAVMLALLLGAATTAVNCMGQATRNSLQKSSQAISESTGS